MDCWSNNNSYGDILMDINELIRVARQIAEYPPIDRAGYEGHRCAYCQADVGYAPDHLGKHSEKCLWYRLNEALRGFAF